jgi:general stress protein CsbA
VLQICYNYCEYLFQFTMYLILHTYIYGKYIAVKLTAPWIENVNNGYVDEFFIVGYNVM